MDAAAALLGSNPHELAQRVRSGERLAEIAAEVHIGSDTLRTVMAEAITASAPPAVAHRLVSQLPSVIAGSKPHRPTGAIERPTEAMESLASRLQVSVERVHESIEDGSFRELLADRGVEARLGILINKKL
ncbi:MAG: hypothetical protein ACR2QK_04235 [Acidimicrobiales bacterium]